MVRIQTLLDVKGRFYLAVARMAAAKLNRHTGQYPIKARVEVSSSDIESNLDIMTEMYERQLELYKLNGYGEVNWSKIPGQEAQHNVNRLFDMFFGGIIHEATEWHDSIAWKAWSKRPGNKFAGVMFGPEWRRLALMEAIDLFSFVLNIFILLGARPQEIKELFLEKNSINMARREVDSGY